MTISVVDPEHPLGGVGGIICDRRPPTLGRFAGPCPTLDPPLFLNRSVAKH